GIDKLFTQPPIVLAGGFAALIAPGLALICAGIMARESARSSQANALVLASARQLMEPADMARHEAASIAEAVTRETPNINPDTRPAPGRPQGRHRDQRHGSPQGRRDRTRRFRSARPQDEFRASEHDAAGRVAAQSVGLARQGNPAPRADDVGSRSRRAGTSA